MRARDRRRLDNGVGKEEVFAFEGGTCGFVKYINKAHLRPMLLTLFDRQMPELMERGHIYIAQPPQYKVKAGRDERYLKDDLEEASYIMSAALNTAVLPPREGAAPITGEPLAELVRKFNVANAIMTGVTLDLSSLEAAEASARADRRHRRAGCESVGTLGRTVGEAHAVDRAYAPR